MEIKFKLILKISLDETTKVKGILSLFSGFQHLNAGRQGERHSSVTFRSVVSKFRLGSGNGNIELYTF